MNLPRNVSLACAANILSAMHLLQGEPQLSDLYVDIADELLSDGMPREVMNMYAETLREGLKDFAPSFRKLAAYAEGPSRVLVTPAPAPVRQLPQDTEFDRLLGMINMPMPRGVN